MKNCKRRREILAAMITLFAISSFDLLFAAGRRSEEPSYHYPYGMAGCGLWSLFIQGQDRGSQLVIWFLRNSVTYDTQTYAITSGTSNCVEGGTRYSEMEQETFIGLNLTSLTKEAAQGEGQHLNALAQVFGCSDQDQFSRFSQIHFAKIYAEENTSSVYQNYRQALVDDPAMNAMCVRVDGLSSL